MDIRRIIWKGLETLDRLVGSSDKKKHPKKERTFKKLKKTVKVPKKQRRSSKRRKGEGGILDEEENELVWLGFELVCPPVFECHMIPSGGTTKKWIRTNDFTMHEALKHTTIKVNKGLWMLGVLL